MTDPIEPGRQCPWCATPATPDATHCSSCGAALAQRESIGDLEMPGLTSVDPALAEYAKRPVDPFGPNPFGPNPTQGLATQGLAELAPRLILGAVETILKG